MFNHAPPSLVHLIVGPVRLSKVSTRIDERLRLVTVQSDGPLPKALVTLA